MSEANEANNPKKVIIEYFDWLVNQLDIYVEKLLKKIPEENNSECGAIIRVFHEGSTLESSVEIGEIEMDDKTNSDQPEEENESENEEENEDSKRNKRAKIEIEDNIEMEEEEKSESEEENVDDKKEEIEIQESTIEDLNTYSHLDFDEDDANERNIEDEEELEEVIYGTEQFTDPYNYNYKPAKRIHYQIEGEVDSTNLRDYLNKMRSLMIEDIRKEEKESIESYNSNRAGYNFDKDCSIEEALFKDRFCFLLDTASDETADIFWYNPCVQQKPRAFTMCLIITDFYVSESRQDLIEKYFERQNEEFIEDYNRNHRDYSDFSLDEEHLFVQYITENIRYNLRKHNYQVQTLSLSRKSILKLEKMDFCFADVPSVCLTEPNTFSSLKSLVIRTHQFKKEPNVKDLSGLRNLEYLEIKHMYIDENGFKGLNKLIKLVLDNCTLKEITNKTFVSSQNSLKFLKIRGITFNVSLKSLKSLRVLALLSIDKFDHIKSLPTQSLEVLQLNTHRLFVLIDREDIGDFFERVNLKKLPHLRLSGTELDKMETKWFTSLTNARRLSLCDNTVESADFLKGLDLFNILELNLSINKIEKFDRTHFQGLKGLKWLNLSENPIKVIKSGVFNGLENLETLILQDIKDLVIKKDSFIGLSSLRVLDLSLSTIKSIHPKAFDHLPKLECLRVKKTKSDLMVKKSMLPRLMQLKEIVLTPSDLCSYKCLKQAGICFKVIEEDI